MFRDQDFIPSTFLRQCSTSLGRMLCGALVLGFGLGTPNTSQAQDVLRVVGGKAVLVITPDTVEICPEGWTCTPPDVEPPAPTTRLVRSTGALYGDTLVLGSAAVGDRVYIWLVGAEGLEADSIVTFVGGKRINREGSAPWTLGGDSSTPPHQMQGWVVASGLSGSVPVEFKRFAGGEFVWSYTGKLEITGGTPPQPPADEDSAAIAKMIGFAQGEQPYQWERLADYDSVFVRYTEQFWPRFAADRDTATRADPFIFHTYYDRMMSLYQYWWRTGDEEMARKGDEYLKAIRDWYWVPNGYLQPRRVFPEGLLVHYYRTGDTVSLNTYNKLTDALTRVWWHQLTATSYLDGRVQGRTVLGEVYRDPAKGRAGVDSLLAWYDRQALGPGKWSMTSYCGGQAHFQAFHAVLYAMIRYNDFVSRDRYDKILPVVKATADTLWTMRDANILFPYVSWTLNEEGSCGGDIANDLNGLLAPTFAWLYRETHAPLYREQALAILDAMLDHTYWIGSLGKQWNQSFWQSQRALYWLKN